MNASADGFLVEVKVQGVEVSCLLDSGADNSVVSKSLASGFVAGSGCIAPRGIAFLCLGSVTVVVKAIILPMSCYLNVCWA